MYRTIRFRVSRCRLTSLTLFVSCTLAVCSLLGSSGSNLRTLTAHSIHQALEEGISEQYIKGLQKCPQDLCNLLRNQWIQENPEAFQRITSPLAPRITSGINLSSIHQSLQVKTASQVKIARSWDQEVRCITKHYTVVDDRTHFFHTETIDIQSPHTAGITSVRTNDSRTHLLTASADKTVKVWNISTRECSESYDHPERVSFACFDPTEQYIISLCDKTMRIWDRVSGICLYKKKFEEPLGRGYFQNATFTLLFYKDTIFSTKRKACLLLDFQELIKRINILRKITIEQLILLHQLVTSKKPLKPYPKHIQALYLKVPDSIRQCIPLFDTNKENKACNLLAPFWCIASPCIGNSH